MKKSVGDEARNVFTDLYNRVEETESTARQLARSTSESETERLGHQFDLLQLEIGRRGGYELDHKIERVLQGLGFRAELFEQPVEQLSGGQKNRMLLAKCFCTTQFDVARRAFKPS